MNLQATTANRNPSGQPILEARDLTMMYGKTSAVGGINFRIHPGEMVALLGPNGAGKSTTLRMLTGFLRPTRGSVIVHGMDILKNPIRVRQRIGYLPESVGGYGHLTCAEFLRYAADVRGVSGTGAGPSDRWIMDVLGLRIHLKTPLSRLSKGWQQRVWLAQALVHDPDILLLDEPTDGLDPEQKKEIRDLLALIAESKVILMSTHILEEAESVCRRVIIIRRGRIVADSSLSTLTDDDGRLFPMYRQLTASS